MNKYESSGLESKHQQQYAEHIMQKAAKARENYNPLYPEPDEADAATRDGKANTRHSLEESKQNENKNQKPLK